MTQLADTTLADLTLLADVTLPAEPTPPAGAARCGTTQRETAQRETTQHSGAAQRGAATQRGAASQQVERTVTVRRPLPAGGVRVPVGAPAVRTRRPVGERPLNRRPAAAGARQVAATACAVRPAARPLRFLVLLAVAAAVSTMLLGMLAMAGDAGDTAPVPGGTAVTQVRSGESMWDVAQRSVPSADTGAVVDRIMQLNPAAPTVLHAGQPLVVPATAGARS